MIVITGMHRSGTSAVAQLLAELGLDLGSRGDMLAADPFNAQGYWENLRVLECNDRLVLGGGRCYPSGYYHRPRGKRSMIARMSMTALWARSIIRPNLSAIDRRAGQMQDAMRSIAGDFTNTAVKDPRFCLTMPHWRRHGAVDRAIVVIRHPAQCADSMARRNRMPRPFGLKMWRTYHRALLANLRGLATVFVDFNRLLDEATCDDELDRVIAFADQPADASVRQRLRQDVVAPGLTTARRDDRVDGQTAALYERVRACHARNDTLAAFDEG